MKPRSGSAAVAPGARRATRRRTGERLFDVVVYTVVILAAIVTLYPFVYVLSMSISDPEAVVGNRVYLWPVGFDLDAFGFVFDNADILRFYYNTLWYTAVGTVFNVTFGVMAAYPLSKRDFFLRKPIMFLYVFTMFFGGGMIPLFIVVVKLGLYNTRWAMVVPGMIATWDIIMATTFFQSLPEDLFESARLEGCSEGRVIWSIALPLSKPILAVLTLFNAVAHWNSFFDALLYLNDQALHPIQIFLRRVLIQSSPEMMMEAEDAEAALSLLQVKYAVIMVTILPIITLYPFLQRYFVKGVMIGSLKG